MKYLILIAVLLIQGCAGQTPYFKAGVGYAINQQNAFVYKKRGGTQMLTSKLPAHFELGLKDGAFEFGIAHDSNYDDGEINNRYEWYQDRVFINYTYEFEEIK